MTKAKTETDDAPSGSGLFVQYGCGWCAPPRWINFDASPTLRFERVPLIGRLYTKNASRFPENVRYGDIVTGLPIQSGTVDLLYASHVLEHLCLNDFRKALTNSHSMLKPNGLFRLVVPDLEARARTYVDALSGGDAGAAERFMRSTHLGRISRSRSLLGLARDLLGNSQHLWMWDEAALGNELTLAGFSSVRRCRFGDSSSPHFGDVEERDRFEADGKEELAMEAKK